VGVFQWLTPLAIECRRFAAPKHCCTQRYSASSGTGASCGVANPGRRQPSAADGAR